jgi:transcriptional regulator with XRE-family HTH domain
VATNTGGTPDTAIANPDPAGTVDLVAEAPAASDNVPTLGHRIRTARTAAGISVRELARRVNVSASFISQVELGRARPAIGTLYAIVSELGLSLDALMQTTDEPLSAESPAPVPPLAPTPTSRPRGESLTGYQPADTRANIKVGRVIWERLTPTDDAHVDFLRITYPPGSESCTPDNLQRHEGWEYGYVTEGRLDVQVMFSSGTLSEGDSINFDSLVPHRLSNPYDTDCVAIWVVVGRQHRG